MADEVKVYFADGSVGSLDDLVQRRGQRITVLRSGQARRWKLVALRERTDGTQNMALRVGAANGMPASGVQTAYSYASLGSPWAGLPPTPPTVDRWTERACIDKGRTNMAGYAEYTIGKDSWIDPHGHGPYAHMIIDAERGSDCVDGLGWYPGTNHHGVVDSDWVEVSGADDDDDDGDPGGGGGGDYAAQLGRIEAKQDAILAKLNEHFR